MKVHGSGGVNRATEIYRKQTRRSEPAGATGASQDQVSISPAAREFQAVLDKLSQLPDVRPETVSRLKQAIDNGTYDVPADDVAGALLRHLKGI